MGMAELLQEALLGLVRHDLADDLRNDIVPCMELKKAVDVLKAAISREDWPWWLPHDDN